MAALRTESVLELNGVPMAQTKEHAGPMKELAMLYEVVVSFVSADALQLSGL